MFEALKAKQAAAWSSAPFEIVAATAADIHEALLDRLDIRMGERVLDLATGTGAVAIRAAQRGGVVTGQDLAPALVDTARRLAADAGVTVEFEVGDCENLPYPDASFDVVCSAQGAVFAPDHRAVARQLARVCRPGGRVGLTAWRHRRLLPRAGPVPAAATGGRGQPPGLGSQGVRDGAAR